MGCGASLPASSGRHGISSLVSTHSPHPHPRTRTTTPPPPEPPHSRARRIPLHETPSRPLRRHPFTLPTPLTPHQLYLQREEFFDTRVAGRPEAWNAIRMAVETLHPPPPTAPFAIATAADDHNPDDGLATAQTILTAAGLTLPTGDLADGAYDEGGEFYQLPEMAVGDPRNLLEPSDEETLFLFRHQNPSHTSLRSTPSAASEEMRERRREEKGKAVLDARDLIVVHARLSDRGGDDVKVQLSKDDRVRVLVRRVKEEAGIEAKARLKIAYLGKLLKEHETLEAQGWRRGDVVNALVFT